MTYSQDLKNFIAKGLVEGQSTNEMFTGAKLRGYEGSRRTFAKFINIQRKKLDIKTSKLDLSKIEDSFLSIVRSNSSLKLTHLCNILKCTPSTIDALIDYHRHNGVEIVTDGHQVYLNKFTPPSNDKVKQIGTTEVKFAIASDLHFGSKACQITAINEFCEVARGKGIKHIFVPGDVTAGLGVYSGQINDLYAITSDDQVDSVVANLPEGFTWYLMGGNHDYSFIRNGGHNIIQTIMNQRKDVKYIGFDEAEIPILNNVDAKLIHPSGSIPYSYSYKLQKNIEQISYTELRKMAWGCKDKPSVRFVLQGHLHIQVQAMFGSIFGAQCGCFEGQTNYLRRLGLTPTVGGYIVSACLGTNGLLYNYEARFYVYDEIEEDWKNYRHKTKQDHTKMKPIFQK